MPPLHPTPPPIPASPPPRPDTAAATGLRRVPLGIRYMMGAALLFSLMTLFVKLAGQRLPPMQIVLARYVVMLAATHAMVRRAGVSVRGTDRKALVGRALTGFAALSLFYTATTRLSLGDVTTIHYTSPVFTALFAWAALRERTGGRVWASTALSLLGVALVARPSFLFGASPVDQAAALLALGGAVGSAMAYTFVRKLKDTDGPLVVIYWFSAIGLALTLPFALPVWLWPTPLEWAFLAAVGASTQAAQVCLTKGLHLEPAGRATAVGYLQIVFAFGWGLLVFDTAPDALSLLGAAVIAVGVLLAARR